MKRIILLLTILFLSSCSHNVIVTSDSMLINQLVEIEDKLQKSNIQSLYRGHSYYGDIKSEFSSMPSQNEYQPKHDKIKYVMEKMEAINLETAVIIGFIENCKIDLLKLAKEDLKEDFEKNAQSIVWRKYNSKEDAISPARLNLMAVKQKDNATIASSYFSGENEINPNEKGLELWKALLKYRTNLIRITGSYTLNKKSFAINPIEINNYKDGNDLHLKVKEMLSKSNADLMEDGQVLKELYISLTYPERQQYSDKNAHWISSVFHKSPLVNAIASLTSLENDILYAHSLALAHWRFKVSVGEYDFNKIIPLATGPSIAIEGETVVINVMMAAFNSENQPIVTTTDVTAKVEYKGDGKAMVIVTPKPGLNSIKGTVSITNKSGQLKTENWEWKMNVIPKK